MLLTPFFYLYKKSVRLYVVNVYYLHSTTFFLYAAVTFLSCSMAVLTLISSSLFNRVIIERGSSKTPAAHSALS